MPVMLTDPVGAAGSRAVLIGVSEYAEFHVIRAARNSLLAMRDLLSDRGELCLTVTFTRPSRPKISGLACTSFTGELLELIRAGIPGKPARLTLGDIYPVLRAQLRAKSLPASSQRGIDTAGSFPFTANAGDQLGAGLALAVCARLLAVEAGAMAASSEEHH